MPGARRVASVRAPALRDATSTAVGNNPSPRSASRAARAEVASRKPRRGRPSASTASYRNAGMSGTLLACEAAQRGTQQELTGLGEDQVHQIIECARVQRGGLEVEDDRLQPGAASPPDPQPSLFRRPVAPRPPPQTRPGPGEVL